MRASTWAISVLVCAWVSSAQLTVATAANMQFAMEDIRLAYGRDGGGDVRAVYGSSGKLCAQVKSGAPFDVFVSADMSYPESLYVWKLATARPRVYAYGTLIIWTTRQVDLDEGPRVCAGAQVRTVAIGDPRLTVYGPAAVMVLRKLGVYEAVKPRLVYGESISQVAQYVTAGSVDVGFCARSIALSDQASGKGVWVDVDSTLYDPIAQGLVPLRYGADNNPRSTARFVQFMYGDTARAVLARFGYRLPEELAK